MKISSQLIDRYLNDTCTPLEREIVQEWYRSFESESEPLLNLSETQQQELNQRMLNQINKNISARKVYGQKTLKHAVYTRIGLVATLLLVLGLFLIRTERKNKFLKADESLATAVSIIHNASSISKKQLLPDGTVIWLKPNSKITYSENFLTNQFRQVKLDGEAFFDVKRDTLHPFIITSGNMNTKVLGTSFNIKAYENLDQAEVSVISGKVLVYLTKPLNKKNRTALLLIENQKAVYSKTTIGLQKQMDFTLKIWKKDSFSFNDTPISDVVRILEKQFSVKIEVTDPEIRTYTLRADFNHQNLPNILELLSKSLGISYQISGDHIQISKSKQE